MDYKDRIIKEYKYWVLCLDRYQCYLGKSYIWLKRDSVNDLADITDEEQQELHKIIRDFSGSIRNLFKADHFNYAVQGNITPQLHVHLVPRYKKKITFDGLEFEDKNWGKNYAPYDKNFKINDSAMKKIISAIRNEI